MSPHATSDTMSREHCRLSISFAGQRLSVRLPCSETIQTLKETAEEMLECPTERLDLTQDGMSLDPTEPISPYFPGMEEVRHLAMVPTKSTLRRCMGMVQAAEESIPLSVLEEIIRKQRAKSKGGRISLRDLMSATESALDLDDDRRRMITSNITGDNVTLAQIEKVFELEEHQLEGPLDITKDVPHLEAPKFTDQYIKFIIQAAYNAECEPTSRLLVDTLLVPAMAHVRQEIFGASHPTRVILPLPRVKHRGLVVLPEHTLVAKVEQVFGGVRHQYIASGRVDWRVEDGGGGVGGLLTCVEVKKPSAFSLGIGQLLLYMSITWYHRRASQKETVLHGFYTDGTLYGFIQLNPGGVWVRSDPISIATSKGRSTVYAYLVHILSQAARTSIGAPRHHAPVAPLTSITPTEEPETKRQRTE